MRTFLCLLSSLLLAVQMHAASAALTVNTDTGKVSRSFGMADGTTVDLSLADLTLGAAEYTAMAAPELTADADDYAPTGFEDAAIVYLTSDGPRSITGMAPGNLHRLINVSLTSDDVITLTSEDANSSAANRFTGGDVVIPIGCSVDVVYDTTNSRWRALGTAAIDGTTLQLNAAGQLYVEPVDISAGTVLGRATGTGSGDPAEISGTDVRVLAGLAVADTPNFANVFVTQAAITYAASVALDFSAAGIQTIALTGDLTFAASTNLAAGVPKTVILTGDSVQRALAFPAGWKFIGPDEPITLDANKVAILSLLSYGTADSTVVAGYSVEP